MISTNERMNVRIFLLVNRHERRSVVTGIGQSVETYILSNPVGPGDGATDEEVSSISVLGTILFVFYPNHFSKNTIVIVLWFEIAFEYHNNNNNNNNKQIRTLFIRKRTHLLSPNEH